MFKIEKGIPVPANREAGRRAKYPFAELEPGDSFFVPGKTRMNSTVHAAAKKIGVVLVVKVITENGVEGTRIWRQPDEAPEAVEDGAPEPVEPTPAPVKRGRVRKAP